MGTLLPTPIHQSFEGNPLYDAPYELRSALSSPTNAP